VDFDQAGFAGGQGKRASLEVQGPVYLGRRKKMVLQDPGGFGVVDKIKHNKDGEKSEKKVDFY